MGVYDTHRSDTPNYNRVLQIILDRSGKLVVLLVLWQRFMCPFNVTVVVVIINCSTILKWYFEMITTVSFEVAFIADLIQVVIKFCG